MLMTQESSKRRVKMVLLGDSAVGKSALVLTFCSKHFPETDRKSASPFADYSTKIRLADDQPKMPLSIWDLTGKKDYDHLRHLNYPNTDIFLLCFSVAAPSSLDSIIARWTGQAITYGPRALKILVGLQADLRDEAPAKEGFVSIEQAAKVAKDIGAVSYVECSALKGLGLELVFSTAARAVLSPRRNEEDEKEEKEKIKIVLTKDPVPKTKKKRCIVC